MAEGSTRAILAALAGDGAVAIAKFAAAAVSGSTAMLTEAIHSLVDTSNQAVLLVGQKRSEKPADTSHPWGYGMEAYFWSFVVALMVFLLGGVLSIYEGALRILHPAPVTSPWVSMAANVSTFSDGVGSRTYRTSVRAAGWKRPCGFGVASGSVR